MRFSFLILTLLLCLPARGDEIPNHPGWTLTRFESSDRVDGDGNPIPFYSLKPPGTKPAITVDSSTAASLMAGTATPESAYGGNPGEPADGDGSVDLAGKASGGIIPGGVADTSSSSRAPATAPVNKFAPSPDAASSTGASSGPHTPVMPSAQADTAAQPSGGNLLHDLQVNQVPAGDFGAGTNIASSGGTGNGGGHPGNTGDGGTGNGGGYPGNNGGTNGTNNGPGTYSPSGDSPSGGPSTNSHPGVNYGNGTCSGSANGHETVVTVVYGGTTVQSAAYVTQGCQPVSISIDPSKVQVVNSTTIVVDGQTLHLIQ